jgi:hypothetical protein
MALVVTATIGLVIWIVLWALNVSGLDASLIGIVMVALVIGYQSIRPHLSGRKDQ